jgi:hypothetical protein
MCWEVVGREGKWWRRGKVPSVKQLQCQNFVHTYFVVYIFHSFDNKIGGYLYIEHLPMIQQIETSITP